MQHIARPIATRRLWHGRRLAAGKSATGYQGYDPPLPKTQRVAAAKISAREPVYFRRLPTNQPVVPRRRGSP
ncbi:hypothetical protein FJTKL_01435 [Diaporthe vaccinii]|uniref:Uncharacterized protein n=1 Tax=Diaporthe vaccinii TaxID=105482 RepID=A0ABR4E0S8_9PEZI